MKNQNKINQTINKITNVKHWGLGLLAMLAIVGMAVGYLGYGLFQSASAFGDIGPNFPGGNFNVSLQLGPYLRSIGDNDPVISYEADGSVSLLMVNMPKSEVDQQSWYVAEYDAGIYNPLTGTWSWHQIATGKTKEDLTNSDPNSPYYTYKWKPGYDAWGNRSLPIPSGQVVIGVTLIGYDNDLVVSKGQAWSTKFALAKMSFKIPTETSSWELGTPQNVSVKFAQIPSKDLYLKLGILVNGDNKTAGNPAELYFVSFPIINSTSSTYSIPWNRVGYALNGQPYSGLPSNKVQLWSSLVYTDSTTEMGGTSRVFAITLADTEVSSVDLLPKGKTVIETGETVEFTASAYNQNGVLMTDDPADFVWTNASVQGIFNETGIGNYTVTATYKDTSISASSTVVVGPFLEITRPAGGEEWNLGTMEELSWILYEDVGVPTRVFGQMVYRLKGTTGLGTAFMGIWSDPPYYVGQHSGSFNWKVGYQYTQSTDSWKLVTLPNGYGWDEVEIAIRMNEEDAHLVGLPYDQSGWFTIGEPVVEPQPLSGVYYSGLMVLDNVVDNFTAASFDNIGFEDSSGFEIILPDNSFINVEISFYDAIGQSIQLMGENFNEFPNDPNDRNGDYYYTIFSTLDSGINLDVARFNGADNLADINSVKFRVFMQTDDWNITRPYLESLSVSYDSVIPTDGFTISVTPDQLSVAPGGTALYMINVNVTGDDKSVLDGFTIDANLDQFGTTDIVGYSFEQLAFIPEDPQPDLGYLLELTIGTDIEHLNEPGLTFVVIGVAGELSVTSAPIGLYITDQNFSTINFTATLQMGATETPIYRGDPGFTIHIYEVNADQYNKMVTVTVPVGVLSIAEDGTYSGSITATELRPGFTYAIFAKTLQHISKRATEDITMPDILTGSETFEVIFPELLAGDIGGSYDVFGDRDDSINSNDFGIFSGLYQKPVDEGFWSIADFNNDGSVNANDFWPFSGGTNNFQEMGDLGKILSGL